MAKVMHVLSGDIWGGAEAQIGNLLPCLGQFGWEGMALLFNADETFRRYQSSKIGCFVLEDSLNLFKIIDEAIDVARRVGPRVIVSHGYKEAFVAAVVANRLSIPLITQFHGSTESLTGFAKYKMALYTRVHDLIARRLANAIVCVSRALAHEFGYDQLDKTCVIHNSAIVRHPIVPTRRPSDSQFNVAIIGRLVPVKRIDVAIQIIDLIKQLDVKLHIVGEGPLRSNLKSLARELGLNDQIVFHGYSDSVTTTLAGCNALLLTSDSEGIPTVVLESLMLGVPVVSTDLPGVREICGVLGENCPVSLFPPGSPNAGATELTAVLLGPTRFDPHYRNSLAAAAQKYFSPARAASEHVSLYNHLCNKDNS